MPPIVRFGIAGLGVASNQIIPAIESYPNVELAGGSDVRHEACEEFTRKYNVPAYTDIEEMFRNPDIDAVYICTPNHLHKDHVLLAAKHGKHIIIEKPMALTVEECIEMNQAADLNGVKLLAGHTHSFDKPIRKMREIVKSGQLGRLVMINTWNFTDFLYRPRMPHELDTTRGGGAVFIQGPHSVDIVRLIGGGMVRSVKATTGIANENRPTEGHYVAYLEFEDGTPATIVYNGYAHFDTAELHYWVGESGRPRDPEVNFRARKIIKGLNPEEEANLKESLRFGGGPNGEWVYRSYRGDPNATKRQPFFGMTVVSCEHGDIRQSPDGLYIYGNEGITEVSVENSVEEREAEIHEMYTAIVEDRPVFHDGRWGQATLEVCLAIYESANTRKEVFLENQTPSPE